MCYLWFVYLADSEFSALVPNLEVTDLEFSLVLPSVKNQRSEIINVVYEFTHVVIQYAWPLGPLLCTGELTA